MLCPLRHPLRHLILLAGWLVLAMNPGRPAGGNQEGELRRNAVAATAFTEASPVAEPEGHPAGPADWWKHAVFYEIYPRSFADSDDDGVGDLKGIVAKLPYLRTLGIDAAWITPCFPSAQVDFGYDVTDYEDIDPVYGSLADMDHLIAQGRAAAVHIILDFVLNHTSDQHPWFIDSRSSRTAEHRNWYIWRDGGGPHQPPNNWISLFGGSAWSYDAKTGQYYYHFFYPEQPDLNWRNPEVKTAMFDITRWWYRRGVAGFRLDAVDTIYENPELTDNPVLPGRNKLGDANEIDKYNRNLPENHQVLKGLRKVADEYGAILIGETWTESISALKQYYGEHHDELEMPMDFMFATVNQLSPAAFRRQIALAEATGEWPVYLIGNHDMPRSYDRYGDGIHDDAIAKLMAAFYLTLRGTPIIYYGEEIGMRNHDPQLREQVKDPVGIRGWPAEKGRDGERTPMQWSGDINAGFTHDTPWLPIPASYTDHNVEVELRDPDSILSMYRNVLALRHSNLALRNGSYRAIDRDDDHVMAYLRAYHDDVVLVALNMTSMPRRVRVNPHELGSTSFHLAPLLCTPGASARGTAVSLPPFGVFLARVLPSS
ncbi:MAG: alpha-glucosidase [Polyangia bacterium]|jgi:alpha-glucosidase